MSDPDPDTDPMDKAFGQVRCGKRLGRFDKEMRVKCFVLIEEPSQYLSSILREESDKNKIRNDSQQEEKQEEKREQEGRLRSSSACPTPEDEQLGAPAMRRQRII